MHPSCEFVGMLRGFPPAAPFEDDYGKYVAALRGLKPRQNAAAELLILKLQLERARQWKRLN